MPKPLAKKHIDALRRHGVMWEVQPAARQGHSMVRVKLLDHDDVFVQPSVAHALGRALVDAAIQAMDER